MQQHKFFSCILDDFQDYIYEGFASLLNKSRSANVGVVFSHQSLGDLDKVSESFRNVVLTNTNVQIILRLNDPDTCEYFAKTLGTKTVTKVTEQTDDEKKTGAGTMREVEQYLFHPNVFKNLPSGYAIVSIPHRDGVKRMKVHLAPRPELPISPLPRIKKVPKPVTPPTVEADDKCQKILGPVLTPPPK